MDDFRFLEDNSLWIIVIIIFLLLVCGCNNGCGGFGTDGLCSLFNGCGNNSILWMIIVLCVLCCLFKNGCGCIFRNDLQ